MKKVSLHFVMAAALQAAHRVISDRRRFFIDDAACVESQQALGERAEIHPELVELFSERDLFA
jgi:uncharacterized protein (DUF1778 family)